VNVTTVGKEMEENQCSNERMRKSCEDMRSYMYQRASCLGYGARTKGRSMVGWDEGTSSRIVQHGKSR
jgi:hypothetical protein